MRGIQKENYYLNAKFWNEVAFDLADDLDSTHYAIFLESISVRAAAFGEEHKSDRVCIWKEDSKDRGVFDTQCGEYYVFMDVDGPEAMIMNYCGFCGKNIKEAVG